VSRPLPETAPLALLPQTARELLDAARRIVLQKGFHALTLQAVQDETGHNKAMVNHYFGSKAGLVSALFDSLAHDQEVELRRRIAELQSEEDPVRALTEDQMKVSDDRRDMRAFAELLPHMLRENRLRWRLAALYHGYRELYAWSLGADGAHADTACLDDLAAVALAVTDGLGIQRAIGPEDFCLQGPYRVWREMLRLYLQAHGIEDEPDRCRPPGGLSQER
jgi:AcrR family transcriptional regulator